MRLLLYDMGSYTQNDIMDTLDKMGISYRNLFYKLQNAEQDAYFEKRVKEFLKREKYDAVFSVNYFPVLAEICNQQGLPYLSWSYDSPVSFESAGATLGFETNYVFLFDREECKIWQRKGFKNVYHLPLAVNVSRLDAIGISPEDKDRYSADISMVGQLYDTMPEGLLLPLGDYEKGFLRAVLETQLQLYGCYFLPEVLTPELLERMNRSYRRLGQTKFQLSGEGLVLAVAKHITHLERTLLLDTLGESCQVHLYGPDRGRELQQVHWKGSAGYFDEMPRIFKLSKINLNISLKCIRSGIPLRALDIMGSGGFLLTNYQQEIADSFIDGEEVVMYSSLEEAVEKCRYYLAHEEERRQIAAGGRKKAEALFGYESRIETMLETAGLLYG